MGQLTAIHYLLSKKPAKTPNQSKGPFEMHHHRISPVVGHILHETVLPGAWKVRLFSAPSIFLIRWRRKISICALTIVCHPFPSPSLFFPLFLLCALFSFLQQTAGLEPWVAIVYALARIPSHFYGYFLSVASDIGFSFRVLIQSFKK